jgi:DNA polymerase-3 subunit beta
MRVSCLQENLAKGLSTVNRAVGTRTALPVLANVLMMTDNGRLRLVATNLEMGITTWIGAKVEEEGAITVPARTLTDLVNALSPERIDLVAEVRTSTLHLTCGSNTADMKGIDAQDFPSLPEVSEDDDTLALPAPLMRETIQLVALAAAREDSRPILTGVLMEYVDGLLTMAAADGFRLSVRTVQLGEGFEGSFSLIVPAQALQEVARACSADEETIYITIPHDRAQVLFRTENVEIASQLLEGNFPDFRQIIPQESGTRTIVDTLQLLQASKRADIFARESSYMVHLAATPEDGISGWLTVQARSAETGSNEDRLPVSIEGDPVEISFNVRYLIDVLNVIGQDRIELTINNPSSPGVLRPVGDDTFTHVVMPMHSSR